MKRFWTAVLAIVLMAAQMPTACAVGTSASAAILMDAASGRVIYEKDAHRPRLIASITKLMTALVALESGHKLEELVTIRAEWADAEGSSIYLRAGDEVSLETLLYGMLLRSGNDAALAVAGYCGGTVEDFVSRMNQKAAELGMEDSHFANPNGLNAQGHYSSAYDMALLARACLENETLRKITATKSITLGTHTFTNHNKLLWRYEGCLGLKTGYTEKAGRTLVSAAERDGLTLICVTLNDPDDWADHAALFDHGFEHYRAEQILREEEVLCRLPVSGSLVPFCPVLPASAYSAVLTGNETVDVDLVMERSVLEAPVQAGTKVGQAVVRCNGAELARIDMVTGTDLALDLAPEIGFLERLRERFR